MEVSADGLGPLAEPCTGVFLGMTTQGSEVQYRLRIRNVPRIVALVCLPCLVFLATLASSSQVAPSTAEIKSPDLTLILQRLEDIQPKDPAQSRPYELTREYKVFHGSDKKPTSEVLAQINFVSSRHEDIQDYSGARELTGSENGSRAFRPGNRVGEERKGQRGQSDELRLRFP